MKEKMHTRRAFIWLMIPILHIAVFFVFSLLATITEFPTGRSGIYLLFGMIVILLMLSFPFVQIGCSIASACYQAKALRNHESKAKNFIMMVVSVLYIVAAVLFAYQLWTGIMSA